VVVVVAAGTWAWLGGLVGRLIARLIGGPKRPPEVPWWHPERMAACRDDAAFDSIVSHLRREPWLTK
jgi:hypothetical protein